MTERQLIAITNPVRPGAPVDRREVDDPAAWDELVRLLADLLFPATPDEPTRR